MPQIKISKKPITAGELLQKLENDPEYQRREREWQFQLAEHQKRMSAAEKPLLEDLEAVGIKVRSSWDLVNTSVPYTKALPILFRHLTKKYPDEIKAGIARAFAVKPSAPCWELLAEEYRNTDGAAFPLYKEGLACAVSAAADSSRLPDVIRLLKDKSLGQTRVLILDALRRSKQPEAKQALEKLSADPELAIQINAYRHADALREKRKARAKSK